MFITADFILELQRTCTLYNFNKTKDYDSDGDAHVFRNPPIITLCRNSRYIYIMINLMISI